MTENIENLIIEHLKSLRNEVRDVKTTMVAEFSELKHRIASLETHVAGPASERGFGP